MKPNNTNPASRPSRRCGMEWFDGILSGGIAKQLGLYAATILAVYALCVFLIWIFGSTLFVSHNTSPTLVGSMRGVLYYFFDAGNLHSETSVSAKILTPIVAFVGMVLLSGLLITTLSNIVERRVENVAKGLVTYSKIRDHYVIIGYGEITICLLHDIFKRAEAAHERMPKVLILTSQDVQKVRAQVQSQLPTHHERNVLFYAGDIESEEHIARLNIDSAREVYVLGEAEEYGRDSKNLECVRIICDLRSKDGIPKNVLTVNVQFDRPASYSTIKKLNIPKDYVSRDVKEGAADAERQSADKSGKKFGKKFKEFIEKFAGKSGKPADSGDKHAKEEIRYVLYFRPFNFFENWARLLWGYYRKNDYDVLDFDPEGNGNPSVLCKDSDRHVHLVIVGFNRMGRALLLEALRICHYPNYDETTGANKTRITVVDAEMERLLPQFESQYPYLRDIADVEIDYMNARVENADIRAMLERSAADECELLTVAVCLRDPDTALATGLSLPESLYYKIGETGISNNDKVRILVRQELQKGIGEILKSDEHKYKHVKIFGMLTDGVSHELLDDTAAMWVNANYWGKKILENADLEKARELWYELNEDNRYSNRYQIEMYDIYERYAGCTPKETLYCMEHLRWCADRRIIGYRHANIKDKNFKTHPLLIPYGDLPENEKIKDTEVVETRKLIEELCKR